MCDSWLCLQVFCGMLARIEQFADVIADSKQQISKVGIVWQKEAWSRCSLSTPDCEHAANFAQVCILAALQVPTFNGNSCCWFHDLITGIAGSC